MKIEEAEKLDLSFRGWNVYHRPDVEIILLELQPNEAIDSHINPATVCFILLEGEGEICVEKESETVQPFHRIVVEAGKSRSWKNTGNTILKLLVIKEVANK